MMSLTEYNGRPTLQTINSEVALKIQMIFRSIDSSELDDVLMMLDIIRDTLNLQKYQIRILSSHITEMNKVLKQ
jgi:hypothetical protein